MYEREIGETKQRWLGYDVTGEVLQRSVLSEKQQVSTARNICLLLSVIDGSSKL